MRDLFAPAEFFDLTDEEKLAAPSFEEMEAGVTVAAAAYSFDHARSVSSPFDYTDITIGANGEPTVEEEPHHENGGFVFQMLLVGAAALAPTRVGRADRFTSAPLEDAPRLRPRGWAVAGPARKVSRRSGSTWVEASAALAKGRVLVPAEVLP